VENIRLMKGLRKSWLERRKRRELTWVRGREILGDRDGSFINIDYVS